MKPHEETWNVRNGDIETVDGECVFEQSYTGHAPSDAERTLLAASAPELARALLAVEWAGHCMSYGRHCPSCWRYPDDERTGEVHKPDCALDAALRKAGVR